MSQKRCPICKKPSEEAFFPFCSKRCAMVDLGRWLKGEYVIPGDETSTDALPEYVPEEEEDSPSASEHKNKTIH